MRFIGQISVHKTAELDTHHNFGPPVDPMLGNNNMSPLLCLGLLGDSFSMAILGFVLSTNQLKAWKY